MFYVDLNSDLGESFGNYTIGMDEEILQYVSSANVACGWHAGDPMVMDKTIALAKKYGTAVGAHPGFPDLMGFGRRNMVVTPEEAKAYLKKVGKLLQQPRTAEVCCKSKHQSYCHNDTLAGGKNLFDPRIFLRSDILARKA